MDEKVKPLVKVQAYMTREERQAFKIKVTQIGDGKSMSSFLRSKILELINEAPRK